MTLRRYFSGGQAIFVQAQTSYGASQLLVLHQYKIEGISVAEKIADRLNMQVIHNNGK